MMLPHLLTRFAAAKVFNKKVVNFERRDIL